MNQEDLKGRWQLLALRGQFPEADEAAAILRGALLSTPAAGKGPAGDEPTGDDLAGDDWPFDPSPLRRARQPGEHLSLIREYSGRWKSLRDQEILMDAIDSRHPDCWPAMAAAWAVSRLYQDAQDRLERDPHDLLSGHPLMDACDLLSNQIMQDNVELTQDLMIDLFPDRSEYTPLPEALISTHDSLVIHLHRTSGSEPTRRLMRRRLQRIGGTDLLALCGDLTLAELQHSWQRHDPKPDSRWAGFIRWDSGDMNDLLGSSDLSSPDHNETRDLIFQALQSAWDCAQSQAGAPPPADHPDALLSTRACRSLRDTASHVWRLLAALQHPQHALRDAGRTRGMKPQDIHRLLLLCRLLETEGEHWRATDETLACLRNLRAALLRPGTEHTLTPLNGPPAERR